MKKDKTSVRDYNDRLHTIGRIWLIAAMILFAAIPVILCIYFKVTPDWSVFGSVAVITPFIIYLSSGIVEPIIYSSILGTNAAYLAFITGNLSNLKVPCVVKAQEIAGTKVGTEENELISTITVATSTLVTVLIIAVFVLFLAVSNLQSFIEKNSFIRPAFACVVYALFGSLGGKYVIKNPKLAIIPTVFVVIISVLLGILGKNLGSAYLTVGIAACLAFAFIQYKIEKKKLEKSEAISKNEAQVEALEKLEEEEPKDNVI